MKTNQVSYDDIIEFFKIYTNYLDYVLYVSLTKKGINEKTHIYLMKVFVILISKENISNKKIILNKLKQIQNKYFNVKYLNLDLQDKLSYEEIVNIYQIQNSVEEFFYAISIFKKHNNKYLKQGIIEFHNFLAHLLVAFTGQNRDTNYKKAINHLYRGTIDCYKSIIKNKCDIDCKFQEEIIKIREQEMKNLGVEATSTQAKYQIVKSYKNIVKKIIM